MVSDAGGLSCECLPIQLVACSHCGAGVKQSRGWQWLTVAQLKDSGTLGKCKKIDKHCPRCPACNPQLFEKAVPADKVGLLWIGGVYYSPAAFLEEAKRLGVSRRIAAIPKGFVVGSTYVACAHPGAVGAGESAKPGVFLLWRPKRIELIVTPEMKAEDWVADYVERGVTLVEVPANDPDHAPSARSPGRRTAAQRKAAASARSLPRGPTLFPDR